MLGIQLIVTTDSISVHVIFGGKDCARETRLHIVLTELLMASNKPKRARKTPSALKDSELFGSPVVHSQSKPGTYRMSVSVYVHV